MYIVKSRYFCTFLDYICIFIIDEFEFAVVAIFVTWLMHDPKYELLEQFAL
jgi:hypothetical protein